MSTSSSQGSKRPLSPFMIGPYYRPQLTSMLSITHRGTGIFLSAGALLLVYACVSLAIGAESFATLSACMSGPLGMLLIVGFVYSLWFHFFNGIRHLGWDIGWGLDLATSYRTGYAVLVLALLAGSGNLWLIYGKELTR